MLFFSTPVLSFDTLGDFSRGLSGSADATLCCFAVDAAPAHVRVERALDLPVAGVSCVRLRPDGALYATAGWDHRVRLFGAKVGRALAALKFHSASVSVVAFPPATLQEYAQEGTLVSASKDGKIAIWQGLYPSKK